MPDTTTDTTTETAVPEQSVQNLMGELVNNPSLPEAGVVRPVAQEVKQEDLITNNPAANVAPVTMQAATAANVNVQAAQGTAVQQDTTRAEQQQQAAMSETEYEAYLVGLENTPTVQHAVGSVHDDSTVQGQLEKLMNFDPATGTPAWASGAKRTADELMAARGMGSSSIAGVAITTAIMEAGIPIAQADAQTYAQMQFQNLTNEQQAYLADAQMQHQTLLTDGAAINASKQFNAQSRTQVAQFFAGLMADIDKNNVAQFNAMAMSNAQSQTQANIESGRLNAQINLSNSNAINAANQFNAERKAAWNKFTADSQLIIDQSNAQWRRDVNTANTAAENAANQVNALNQLEISNSALNNLWQASRDEAKWVNDNSQSDQDRAHNLAIAAMNRDTQFDLLAAKGDADFWGSIGDLAIDIIDKVTD